MRKLLRDAAERGIRFRESLDERAVFPSREAVDNLNHFDEPLPENPTDPQVVLELLDQWGTPAAVASAGGRYFGFVTGSSLPAAVAANWLAGAWDQNGGLVACSPVAARLEEVALRWLVELFAFPAGTAGSFATGATMANFTALAAARHAVLKRAGWDVEADGLFGAPPITVIVGEEAHSTLFRSLGLLGLGRSRVLRVPVDDQGRMLAEALPTLNGPAIICTQAGNVNSGAFDPIGDIAEAAHSAGAWVHVDGAFGLWAAAAPQHAYLTHGMNQADSWATDAHKWLNVPYDSGLAFVRSAEDLRGALSLSAPYLIQGEQREPSQFTPELSRRARGIEVWAALRSLGRAGLAELIERNCQQARQFAAGLGKAGYSILNDVVLNQVVVSFGDATVNQRMIAAIAADGTCWCSSTIWKGHSAIRISVSSWATTDEDIERSLAAVLRIARDV